MKEEEFKIKYQEASDPMHQKVEDLVRKSGQDFHVYYSAYESTPEGIPIDNLDEVPIKGKIKVVEQGSDFFGSGKGYRSKVLDSPTWLELCVVANEMIIATGDLHHIYLEAVMVSTSRDSKQALTLIDGKDEIKITRLIMGS